MSLARNLTAVGQIATAPFEEEVVTNLRTGRTFTAKIQPVSEFELDTDQGRDARESSTFSLRDRTADVRKGDQLSAVGEKYEVLRREDNGASFHVSYRCVKIVPGVDS